VTDTVEATAALAGDPTPLELAEEAGTHTGPGRHPRPGAALLHGRGLVGLLLVGTVFLLGLLAPVIAPFHPNEQLPHANLLSASSAHWFGTDDVNRDVLSRVLHGIRVDVLVVFVAVPLGALIGCLFALVSTINGVSDVLTQRFFDVVLAFPAIILAIGLAAVTGPGIGPVLAVIVLVEIPVFGRLLRTSILRVRELPFTEAATVMGAGQWWVLRRHLIPNSAEPLLVQLALSMTVAVFLESAMSFIGIGVRPPSPSLGSIIADSVANLDANPWFAVGPLIVVAALVLGFQLIAQALASARRS